MSSQRIYPIFIEPTSSPCTLAPYYYPYDSLEVFMRALLGDPYIELYVPDAKTEQEFLRLTVQAAAMKYRAAHHKDASPPQTNSNDVIALRQCVDRP